MVWRVMNGYGRSVHSGCRIYQISAVKWSADGRMKANEKASPGRLMLNQLPAGRTTLARERGISPFNAAERGSVNLGFLPL